MELAVLSRKRRGVRYIMPLLKNNRQLGRSPGPTRMGTATRLPVSERAMMAHLLPCSLCACDHTKAGVRAWRHRASSVVKCQGRQGRLLPHRDDFGVLLLAEWLLLHAGVELVTPPQAAGLAAAPLYAMGNNRPVPGAVLGNERLEQRVLLLGTKPAECGATFSVGLRGAARGATRELLGTGAVSLPLWQQRTRRRTRRWRTKTEAHAEGQDVRCGPWARTAFGLGRTPQRTRGLGGWGAVVQQGTASVSREHRSAWTEW